MTTSKDDKHSVFSSIREEYVEYMLLAEICSAAWKSDKFISISRSQTDAFGYDLIPTRETVSRHVQLKAMAEGGKATYQKVNTSLAKAPSGCVIWLTVDRDTLRPKRYGWFGSKPNLPLPDLGDDIATHTKGDSTGRKAQRPNIRKVSKSKFEWLDDIDQLISRLFER